MIEIVNGHFKRFDETIIAYSKLKSDHEQLFAIYATTDKEEMQRKNLEINYDNKQDLIQLSEKIESAAQENKYPLFGTPYPLQSEKDLFWTPTCVAFVGEYPTLELCELNTQYAVWTYFNYVVMQKKQAPKPNPVITHINVDPSEIIDHIDREYLWDIYSAIQRNDPLELNDIKQKFAIFSFGSSFYDEARKLFEHINSEDNQDLAKKILFTIAMKYASEKEEFELAAKFRDMIIA